MTSDTHIPDRLVQLGEALDRAVRADLAAQRQSHGQRVRRPRHLPRSRRLAVGIAATVVLVPAVAVAATQLLSTTQVAASLPQGTKALIGTSPTCTVVTADVEYHCVLAHAPGAGGPNPVAPGDNVASPTTSGGGSVSKPGAGQSSSADATSPAQLAAMNWTGTVEPTVDATKHVNGGCRAQNADGTDWECYIGRAAVTQKIIGAGFLGQYSPTPGVG